MAGRSYNLNPCAARRCATRVDASKLMCPAHWRMVPAGIKTWVYEAWRAYQSAVRSSTEREVTA